MTPLSVGIIMDGNRRWAREKGMNPWDGHKAGAKVLRDLAKAAPRLKKEYGLETVTFYTLSTENWNRDPKEIEFLLMIFREALRELISVLDASDQTSDQLPKVIALGQKERFPEDIQTLMNEVEEKTKNNTGYTVAFALSYGGRPEIIEGINKAIEKGEKVDEESFKQFLWSKDLPDPDIIIRTGGEKRLSNFLTWGSVYSELFFIDTYWPDFSPDIFEGILKEYKERERRHGK